MLSLNNIVLSGRVTIDPKIYSYRDGNGKVAKLAVAHNYVTKTKDGQKVESFFLDINVFGQSADFVERNIAKGDECVVVGTIGMNSWTTDTGEVRTRVVVNAQRLEKVWKQGEIKDETKASAPHQSKKSGNNYQPQYYQDNTANMQKYYDPAELNKYAPPQQGNSRNGGGEDTPF